MPRVIRRFGAIGLAAWVAIWPLPVLSQSALSVHPLSSELREPVVRALATAAEPTPGGKGQALDPTGKTPNEVIVTLCGGLQAGYYDEFQKLNGGAAIDLNSRIDAAAAETLRWPACAMLRRPANLATVADTLPSLADAPWVSVRPLKGTSLTDLQAALKTAIDAAATDYDIEWIEAREVAGASIIASVDTPDPEPNPPIFNPCSATRPPFDAQKVAAYYDLALSFREPEEAGFVVVWVFDNGFYGHNPSATPDWIETFPKDLFADWSNQESATGPQYKWGNETIYPSNYPYATPATLLSGHGTHVTGLVLGGPEFATYRSRFYFPQKPDTPEQPRKAWLRLGVVNLAKGDRTLLPGSEDKLFALLTKEDAGKIQGRIVNLSLSYQEAVEDNFTNTFSPLYARDQDLFVVAAGNEGAPNLLRQFPAKLGGPSGRNVITVAAHDDANPVRLTEFTNKGPAVDIAAPGCSVMSWIDMDTAHTMALSGTSQAAPLVTFAAALVRSLNVNQKPSDLKVRLLASADLMADTISPRLKLNIAKALLIKHDYLRLSSGVTYLGTLKIIRGLRCATDGSKAATYGYDLKDILAYKSGPGEAVLMYAGQNTAHSCKAEISQAPDAYQKPFLKFTPLYRLDGVERVPVPASLGQHFLDEVDEIVMHSPPPGRFQGGGS